MDLVTEFPELDGLAGPAAGGELVIVGGRPGAGVTAFLMGWASRAAKDRRVLFCSLDLSRRGLERRLTAAGPELAGPWRPGTSPGGVQVLDTPCLQIEALGDPGREPAHACFIDHLDLIRRDPVLSIPAARASTLRALRQRAQADGSVLVVGARLTPGEDQPGTGEGPADAGACPQLQEIPAAVAEADRVLFVHRGQRTGAGSDRFGVVTVARNRSGATGMVTLGWDWGRHTWVSLHPGHPLEA